MKTTFTARHFQASPRLQEYALEAVKKLEQFYDKIIVCDIILRPGQDDENPTIAELNVKVPKTLINVSEEAPNYEQRSEEHTSELQSRGHLVCRLLLEKKNEDKC